MPLNRPPALRQRGATLIELMITMVLGLLLGLAVLMALKMLTQHNVRLSDVALRDSESRAAMDLLAHDLSGAGFLLGGAQVPCDAVLTFNAGIGGNYYAHLPVDALAGAAGSAMPFATALTLNYPAAGSGVASDVLVLSMATSARVFNDLTAPLINVSPNNAYDPTNVPLLPVVSTVGLTLGDVALVHVPIAQRQACLRVPVSGLASGSGSGNVASNGPLMPGASYGGFSALMPSVGFAFGLNNAAIFQGRIVDIGSPAQPLQVTTAFYVDGTTNPWPTLMRASFSLLDDTPVGAPQPIAAGVVSLQALFGVDPGNTGQITAYETGAQMRANLHQWAIRSVKLAMVTRALHPDRAFTNTTPSIAIPGGFASVPIPADFLNYRYSVQQTEIAIRNCLWQRC